MNLQPVHYDKDVSKLQRNDDGVSKTILTGHWIDVREYGAVCDGVTDDTAAVQAAINACLAGLRPKAMVVPGYCRITSSLIYNVAIGSQDGVFQIIGMNGGFVMNSAMTLFDSTLPYISGVHPPTCSIQFTGIVFECLNPSLAAYTISGKFLLVYFDNCQWRWLKLVNSASYLQSWRLTNCSSGGHQGIWANCVGSYDVHFGVRMEAGSGAFFKSASGDNAGLSFNKCLYQGASGPFIEAANIKGMEISGCYFENNTGQNFKFLSGSGVHMSGNFIRLSNTNQANTAFYDVQWNGTSGISTGNHCIGRLHDNTGSNMVSLRDSATVAQKVPTSLSGGGSTPADITATLPSTTPVTLGASGSTSNITSVTLVNNESVARDYEVNGCVQQLFATDVNPDPTVWNTCVAATNTVSATLPPAPDISRTGITLSPQTLTHPTSTLLGYALSSAPKRYTVPANSSLTVYLVWLVNYTGTAPQAYGTMRAKPLWVN